VASFGVGCDRVFVLREEGARFRGKERAQSFSTENAPTGSDAMKTRIALVLLAVLCLRAWMERDEKRAPESAPGAMTTNAATVK
jgi:hypothetical protein